MRHNLLFALRCFLPLFFSGLVVLNVACKEERSPINDDSGKDGDGEDEYEYVDDRYDNGISCEEYLANYRGVPFKKDQEGNSLFVISGVPATIEAEDFDDGGQDISFNFKNSTAGNYKDYRTEKGVAISKSGTVINIGNINNGDWLCYTLQVTQAGAYSIETYCVSGGGKTSFYFEVDGKSAGQIVDSPEDDWSVFSHSVKVTNVQLSEGKHVLRWYTTGSINLDKFVFTRTGEYTGDKVDGSQFEYPRYGYYEHNPLFVNFSSQMFQNSFTGTLYTADPSAHVWADGRLYVYASHDMEPTQGCDRMDRYHVFSTTDMKNWTDHGEIMNSATVKAHVGMGIDGFMWAPDCAYNKEDQLYYFYFPHKIDANTWRIFVATSKEPAAKFRVKGVIDGIPSTIDPCVFVDDDGQPYIYTSGAGKGCWGAKLRKDDWTKLDGVMTPLTGFTDFHEAPWVHKYKGKYYLSHSDNHAASQGGNRMQYSMSNNPLAPYTPCGAYMYPHGEETAHGSIVEYNGGWYSFYHTANYSGKGALRSVCVDPIEYDLNNKLKMVRNWGTPRSGKAVEVKMSPSVVIQAEDYNAGGEHYGYHKNPSEGGMKQETQNGITYLKGMKSGEWVRYSINVREAGRYGITCRMFQKRSGGKFRIAINGVYKTGEISLSGSAGVWNETFVYPVELEAGEQYIDFRIKGGDIDMDWIKFGAGYSQVPGVIQAEDFDEGQYSFKNGSSGNFKSYRSDQGVAISASNNVVHISNTTGGDWIQYTFNVQEKISSVKVRAAAESGGKFALSLDGGAQLEAVSTTTGNWNAYNDFTVSNVQLSPGTHTMKIHILSALNIDWFEFR
ncbi:carbohydrate-binding protein [uncultured Bacteroides sp.]|uniref:carbohydrate-binding protein n=1 Tax=uncultured Bacteroides sp. TaxID=162156 RepID=UPI0025F342BD|nr:carbohydrate-binding protein [uncultured Bacteroides sp.]